MLKRIGLYYRTIKHLKPIQIRYRLWYILRDKFRKLTNHSYPFSIPKEGYGLKLISGISKPSTFNFQPSIPDQQSVIQFTFLNQSHTFEGAIDWNINKYSKLWTYNLNYFDYLHQESMIKEKGLEFIHEFIDHLEVNKEGLESYPISLRGINWIKFLSKYSIKNSKIDASLYAQYQVLLDNIEYHILGNHLLENGCSLLFGAFYFRDKKLWEKAQAIIHAELEEQILKDGGHFERSVMYHSIILERLLGCYEVLINNSLFNEQDELEFNIAQNVRLMLGWLMEMQWKNGDVPEVNDHVPEMLPDITELFKYADRLNILPIQVSLGESGYRKYQTGNYEILVDAGNIGPDYVPGHAHSDIFSFLFRINENEIITETGTSTYENIDRRYIERSTAAHNTVMVNNKEQNEVWSAFRVGRRGHTAILEENLTHVKAYHDGYAFDNIVHERHFEFSPNSITIRDSLKGENEPNKGAFYAHFNLGVHFVITDNGLKGDAFTIVFDGHDKIQTETYKKSIGYNKLSAANGIIVHFENNLTTKIEISAL